MTVHRVMGIETEFGISVPGHPHMNAMVLSNHIVAAYAHDVLGLPRGYSRWDYDEESPLRDARGFDMSRAEADPSQLTDEDIGMANVILPNGARLYVDHAHPEYSTPEVTNPRDAVLWDRAGTVVMQRAMAAAENEIVLYKNNTDNKGASYGCHENYLMRRETAFAQIVQHLSPFFITRQIFTGAGRVGIGQDSRGVGFQLTQRADFFEVEVGLETTLKRPIINTRDEPHADPELWRRLHVIVGDANLSDYATFLKLGSTSIVLAMIEAGVLHEDWTLERPVSAMHEVSHDTQLTRYLTLRSGERVTALELQHRYLAAAVEFCAGSDPATDEVLAEWERTLTLLETDRAELSDRIDWIAKYALMQAYRDRDGLDWDDPRIELIDLQYSDLRPAKGLAFALERKGRLQRMFSDEQVATAVVSAPIDTRAYFRGECVRRYPDSVAAASWDSVIFDISGIDALQRVPTLDPYRGTKAHVEHVLDECPTADELLARLARS